MRKLSIFELQDTQTFRGWKGEEKSAKISDSNGVKKKLEECDVVEQKQSRRK